MIVLGIDPHKKSHTAVAVRAATGEIAGELTVPATDRGHGRLLAWSRSLEGERRFALEDCRHLSGRLERFLLERGESCVRVPPKLMAGARRSARTPGKSDPIDAAAVARAALREPDLPEARLAGPERELRLLADHRDDLVAERTRVQGRLRWHLHDLGIGAEVPPKGFRSIRWLDSVAAQLRGLAGVHARIAREQLDRCRELNAQIGALEREVTGLAVTLAPELLALPGVGGLTAARLVGETAGAARFSDAARFAMHSGVAPVPVSSGRSDRYRLNRRGNRRLNCALHRMAVTQMRTHDPARAYLERKRAEGKTKREALRCLKRHLARSVWRALRAAEARRQAMLAATTTSTQPVLMLAS
ncbi:MAG TPA: IS110 family transposase [Thermoleophilia bacterium]|nr:IS110 family transposase [Thermoleophilia bacterium]